MRAFTEGRQRWPELATFAFEAFRVHVEASDPDGTSQEKHGADLFLAAAATRGDPYAVAAFDARVVSQVPRWLASLRISAELVEEVAQTLRLRLLTGASPKLRTYRGRGPLDAWVRVSAIRIAFELLGATVSGGATGTSALALIANTDDPHAQFLRRHYGPGLEKAATDVIAGLSARQRTLLRFHYVDGMNIDAIGVIYKVHRATVARWLADAREEIESGITARMWDELGVPPAEFQSLWRVLGTEIALSLSQILQTMGAQPDVSVRREAE